MFRAASFSRAIRSLDRPGLASRSSKIRPALSYRAPCMARKRELAGGNSKNATPGASSAKPHADESRAKAVPVTARFTHAGKIVP
jgi:hypothetical protein